MKKMEMKYCDVCNNGFFCRRKSAKFCSPACKQLDYRRRNGQTVLKSEQSRKTLETLSQRQKCPHCGAYFWTNTTGRKRKFCSNSCRVSANRFKISAAYKYIKAHTGKPDYDAYMMVAELGTVAVDKIALQNGAKYNYNSRRYEGATAQIFGDHE